LAQEPHRVALLSSRAPQPPQRLYTRTPLDVTSRKIGPESGTTSVAAALGRRQMRQDRNVMINRRKSCICRLPDRAVYRRAARLCL